MSLSAAKLPDLETVPGQRRVTALWRHIVFVRSRLAHSSQRSPEEIAALTVRLAELTSEHARAKEQKAERRAARDQERMAERERVHEENLRLQAEARLRRAEAKQLAEFERPSLGRAKKVRTLTIARPETTLEARVRAGRATCVAAALAESTGGETFVESAAWELRRRCDPTPYHESPPRDLPDGFYDDDAGMAP